MNFRSIRNWLAQLQVGLRGISIPSSRGSTSRFRNNQNECERIILTETPNVFNEIQLNTQRQNELQREQLEIENRYPDEVDTRGLTPEYRVNRSRRNRVVVIASGLEGLSTAFTFNMMFAMPWIYAIPIGIFLACLVFIAASSDRVLGVGLPMQWSFLVLASYNLFIMLLGIALGLKNHAEMEFLLVHAFLSIISFFFILTALKYSAAIHHDHIIAETIKARNRILSEIKQVRQTLNDLNKRLRQVMDRFVNLALECRNDFFDLGRDPNTLILQTRPRVILNQFFGEDVFPISEVPPIIHQIPPGDIWNGILGYYNGTNLQDNTLTTGTRTRQQISEPERNPDTLNDQRTNHEPSSTDNTNPATNNEDATITSNDIFGEYHPSESEF